MQTMQCAMCKGKGFCGLPRCPIVSRILAQRPLIKITSYDGESPSIFVGSYNYPNVIPGPLMVNDTDTPTDWLHKGFGIDDIVAIRAATIRGFPKEIDSSFQEIAISSKPLQVEAAFSRPVSANPMFDGIIAPIGLSGNINKIDVIDNAVVPRVVDKITSDSDLHATEGSFELYKDGIDVYRITQLLSAGLLGGKKRKVVPTRWAITAVDDMLFHEGVQQLKRNASIEEIQLYEHTLFGNQLVITLIPGDWGFEMVEIWGSGSMWGGSEGVMMKDGERKRRTKYSPLMGAYYSARLAVVDHLNRMRRSARVIVVRTINSDYWAPLGTWVIREATRSALEKSPIKLTSLKDVAPTITSIVGSPAWMSKSNMLMELRTQKTLFDFR